MTKKEDDHSIDEMRPDQSGTALNQLTVFEKRSVGEMEQNGAPIWLISFTDVVALMLTFFVLLYAISDPDPIRFDRKIGITEQAKAEYRSFSGKTGSEEGTNINRISYLEAENLDYLQAIFEEIVAKHEISSSVMMDKEGNDLALKFSMQNWKNNKVFINFIIELSPLLNNLDNSITLAGDLNTISKFTDLQYFGQLLRKSGYAKPIKIAKKTFSYANKKDVIILFIQPHTGKEIR